MGFYEIQGMKPLQSFPDSINEPEKPPESKRTDREMASQAVRMGGKHFKRRYTGEAHQKFYAARPAPLIACVPGEKASRQQPFGAPRCCPSGG